MKSDMSNTIKRLEELAAIEIQVYKKLNELGDSGVKALKAATPKATGTTAESWTYNVEKTSNGYRLTWSNSNVNDGVPIAVLLNVGHATGTGGYVTGHHFIEPALLVQYDKFINEIDKLLR